MRRFAQRSEGLFAYGTLAVADVMEALTGRSRSGRPATLPDHARYRVRGQVFPAAVERPGDATDGILYDGMEARDWSLLDAFEGDAYELCLRPVLLQGGGQRLAFVYLLRRDRQHILTSQPWDMAAFTRRHLGRTLAICRAVRAAGARG